MNSYVGMTMVKKEQGQDLCRLVTCEKYAFLTEIIILSLFFF